MSQQAPSGVARARGLAFHVLDLLREQDEPPPRQIAEISSLLALLHCGSPCQGMAADIRAVFRDSPDKRIRESVRLLAILLSAETPAYHAIAHAQETPQP